MSSELSIEEQSISAVNSFLAGKTDELYLEKFHSSVKNLISIEKFAASSEQFRETFGTSKFSKCKVVILQKDTRLVGLETTLINEQNSQKQFIVRWMIVFHEDGKILNFTYSLLESNNAFESNDYVDMKKVKEVDVLVGKGTKYELEGKVVVPVIAGMNTNEKSEPVDNVSDSCETSELKPGVILIHGSGPNDMNETVMSCKPFLDLGLGLASVDPHVITLRYNKRTFKYGNELVVDDITLKEEVIDDALDAVRTLLTIPSIDKKKIYLLGHSLGGYCIPLIAREIVTNKSYADIKDCIAGFIMIASCARPIWTLMLEQLEYLSESSPSNDVLKEIRSSIQQIESNLSNGKLDDKVMGQSMKYWNCFKDDITSIAKEYLDGQKVLIIQCGRDYQVTNKDFELWKKTFNESKTVILKEYPKLNHLMIEGVGPSMPEEYGKLGQHVSKELIADIVAFINQQ